MFNRYGYQWRDNALLIWTPAGYCWVPGNKGVELHERLLQLDRWQLQTVLSEYEHRCTKDK